MLVTYCACTLLQCYKPNVSSLPCRLTAVCWWWNERSRRGTPASRDSWIQNGRHSPPSLIHTSDMEHPYSSSPKITKKPPHGFMTDMLSNSPCTTALLQIHHSVPPPPVTRNTDLVTSELYLFQVKKCVQNVNWEKHSKCHISQQFFSVNFFSKCHIFIRKNLEHPYSSSPKIKTQNPEHLLMHLWLTCYQAAYAPLPSCKYIIQFPPPIVTRSTVLIWWPAICIFSKSKNVCKMSIEKSVQIVI